MASLSIVTTEAIRNALTLHPQVYLLSGFFSFMTYFPVDILLCKTFRLSALFSFLCLDPGESSQSPLVTYPHQESNLDSPVP